VEKETEEEERGWRPPKFASISQCIVSVCVWGGGGCNSVFYSEAKRSTPAQCASVKALHIQRERDKSEWREKGKRGGGGGEGGGGRGKDRRERD
jgi:hypothetical protein